jgi:hypothetical protein
MGNPVRHAYSVTGVPNSLSEPAEGFEKQQKIRERQPYLRKPHLSLFASRPIEDGKVG